MNMIKLFSYFRSSAAYRVRIALNLKELPYDYEMIHLLRSGGEQHSNEYKNINPLKLVPTLIDGEHVLSQSLAIIEYLEEKFTDTFSLLPEDLEQRSYVRQLSQIISCDIHPINNLRVLKYLNEELNVCDEGKKAWYAHWIKLGFDAFEEQLTKTAGQFCVGEQPTIADCCLIPQVYNALRFKINIDNYPKIQNVYQHCMSIHAFKKAMPENQPDAA